ncbi:putative ParB-like nuclease superfamily [Cyanobium sp. NIES-981]|nr:putative ParB-like nuclease superfamily [Cyanobium sp. NIES-981]
MAGIRFPRAMALRLPPFQQLPPPQPGVALTELPVARLRPTQLCVGMAEVRSRQRDFQAEDRRERRDYLGSKPVPLVRSAAGEVWMVDRHHRLRALLELEPEATAFGYVALQLDTGDRAAVLEELRRRGWLYLYDGRGLGPLQPSVLPAGLTGLQDDPYRSLVWRLKKDGVIEPAPLIPFHEFRWGAWLRSRSLPPFSSAQLEPALPAARALARSAAASHLAGWKGGRRGG